MGASRVDKSLGYAFVKQQPEGLCRWEAGAICYGLVDLETTNVRDSERQRGLLSESKLLGSWKRGVSHIEGGVKRFCISTFWQISPNKERLKRDICEDIYRQYFFFNRRHSVYLQF